MRADSVPPGSTAPLSEIPSGTPGNPVAEPDEAPSRPIGDFIDFDLAARLGARVVRPGPGSSPAEAAEAVADLRAAAAEAVEPVAATARMRRDPAVAEEPPALVVDRASWVRANIAAFADLLGPVQVRPQRTSPTRAGVRGAAAARAEQATTALGRRTTAVEMGGLMGLLSGKVLGQFDVFTGVDAGEPGRLLLVAPNIVAAEQELGLVPRDFRRWVCLHEETHRLQFGANPWLRRWITEQARELSGDLVGRPQDLADRLAAVLKGLPGILRDSRDEEAGDASGSASGSGSGQSLTDLLQTPEQRAAVARVVAVMSLLEGHADVVMDEVGPRYVPTVQQIRAAFTERRRGRGGLDSVLRRVIGLDAKLRQYAEGASFVRGVVDTVGWDDFNAVWTGPETLPTPAEIADPPAWVARVLR
ncbi:zinc-dependent metalloprotease [Kineococcus gynurae]|uniref:Zinc-dependent metalloprotease n=1 Tax=Kineococcus gynurae TaxID=452979 RepID=A0ABV5LTW3_9ACTN